VAVLIITCPCALGLAIPTVQTVASGAMFRAGVLLNSGDSIERLADVDHVIFDKTGTLTLPELEVTNAAAIPEDLLSSRRAACTCEPSSGRSSGSAASNAKSPLPGAVEEPEQGVRGYVGAIEVRLGRPSFLRRGAVGK